MIVFENNVNATPRSYQILNKLIFNKFIFFFFLDKPEVIPLAGFLSPYRVIEGQTAALKCALIDANPYTSIIWRWSRTYRPEYVLYSGPNYTIPNIHRNMSGTYNCTASNSVGTSEAGITTVDVLCE